MLEKQPQDVMTTLTESADSEPRGPFGYKLSDLYSLTMLACLIALIQLLFFIGMCCYVRRHRAQNGKRIAKEKAAFYQFFYKFHQLIPGEKEMDEGVGEKERLWELYLENHKR